MWAAHCIQGGVKLTTAFFNNSIFFTAFLLFIFIWHSIARDQIFAIAPLTFIFPNLPYGFENKKNHGKRNISCRGLITESM